MNSRERVKQRDRDKERGKSCEERGAKTFFS